MNDTHYTASGSSPPTLADLASIPVDMDAADAILARARSPRGDGSGASGPLAPEEDGVLAWWTARLDGLRHTGAGFIARCPAHDDNDPSLSLRLDDGQVLVHCFSGCGFEQVLAAMNERPAAAAPPPPSSGREPGGARRAGSVSTPRPAFRRDLVALVDPDKVLGTALAYCGMGWSVMPLHLGRKVPKVKWTPLMERQAPCSTIETWFHHWPFSNVAVITGRVSNLVVLDVDDMAALQAITEKHGPITTATVSTGRGVHFYFKHPGVHVPTVLGLLPKVDLKAERGYVAAPPSIHASGRRYVWTAQRPLAEMPAWLLELARAR